MFRCGFNGSIDLCFGIKVVTINVVMADSTTMKVHRHGGGLKGGFKLREEM